AWRDQLPVTISGKQDGLVPREGELDVDKVRRVLEQFARRFAPAISCSYLPPTAETPLDSTDRGQVPACPNPGNTQSDTTPPLPMRPPVLCAGCPHRASFYAARQATADLDVVFCGDIGCYTLGAMPPLSATHTCLCMGAGITIAAGLQRAEPQRKHIAFIGDSTFFHTGIPGLINAVYN
ncbi:MAG: thiamine pyrophosphate-dependent enzyme, partial [Bacillota bacterium]